MRRSAGAKAFLKRFGWARACNARLRCWQTKREYQALCRRYGTASALSEPDALRELGRRLWRERAAPTDRRAGAPRPNILFVGTDWEQDRSGMIPALRRLGDVTVFEQADGRYGQRWIGDWSEADAVRRQNGRRLRDYVERLGPLLVIGQMWGFTMDWRALAELRAAGIPVVNIAMDDRHAFAGRRLGDGSRAGTLALAPHLSLACTDAPECVAWYRAEGCAALYLPEASDPGTFAPREEEKRHDVAFVGAAYGVRAELVRALERAGMQVVARGSGWPEGRIGTEEMAELFARSRIVLGCGTIGHCPDFVALKLRDFDAPMSGSLYLTHANPDLDALFEGGAEIETFRDARELVEKARALLADEPRREGIARAGRRRAAAEHTWDQRFAALLRALPA